MVWSFAVGIGVGIDSNTRTVAIVPEELTGLEGNVGGVGIDGIVRLRCGCNFKIVVVKVKADLGGGIVLGFRRQATSGNC